MLFERHDRAHRELERPTIDPIAASPISPVWMCWPGRRQKIHLKLESHGLTGSIKGRTARGLLDDLEQRGRLEPGATLIESTSGNLGVALALLCRDRGYSFVAVVDARATTENVARMVELGAEIEMVHKPDHTGSFLSTRLRRVAELLQARPSLVWTNQYNNEANPRAHARSTAPEILRQMGGEIDALFVAVSTCGTLAGVGSYLREASPRTRVIAVDAQGSVVLGGAPGPRLLVGIGADRAPSFALDGLYDDVVHVKDEMAFATCRALQEGSGLSVGGSSGAVIAACHAYLSGASGRDGDLDRVVCICPDGGDNYATTIWNDDWIRANGLDLTRARERLGFSLAPCPEENRPE